MAKSPRSEEFLDEPLPADGSLTGGLANPDDYVTTQTTSGPNPVSVAVNFDPAKPLDIAPWEPYPTGSPPKDPHEPRPAE